jgi:hypothetical protein
MEENLKIPEAVLQEMIQQMAQATPFTPIVYSLILLILAAIAFFGVLLFWQTNKKKDLMATEYLNATVELSNLRISIELQQTKMVQVEEVLKQVIREGQTEKKTAEQMDEAIQKVHGIVESLNKIVWKEEAKKKSNDS